MTLRIDLNCDLGEGAGRDAELMPWITSANVACGGHAGDEATMRATVALALRHGVAVGAHPGFPDPGNFGRRDVVATAEQIGSWVSAQIDRLQAVARAAGTRLAHVKPHGALYNLAARDAAVAAAIAAAVRVAGAELILVGLAGSALPAAGRRAGLRVAHEVFADRAYRPDGSLVPRDQEGALIATADAACAQVLRLLRDGVTARGQGHAARVAADTVCLHGDGSHAVDFARALRQALGAAGVSVVPLVGK